MPYELSIMHDQNYIHLNVYDPMTFAEHQEARERLLARCNEHGIKNALVNLYKCELTQSTSKTEQLEFSQGWKNLEASYIAIALVLPEDRLSQDEFYFVIELSKRYGGKILPFYDEKEAVEWIENQT